MYGASAVAPLPEGYAGGLMIELEEERSQEDAASEFILARARSLAWQAVRHTPCNLACADICLGWLRRARVWAARRDMEALAEELAHILERLEGGLPKLATPKYQFCSRLAEQLKRHEGLRLAAYLDSEGVLSIGYGHNCAAWPVGGVSRPGDKISLAQAELLFKNDLELAEAQAGHAIPVMSGLNAPRRAVLINMTFNMGIGSAASGRGIMGFKRMHAALQQGDFALAAREMLDSKWARQVGPRSRELAAQMSSGTWPGELHV